MTGEDDRAPLGVPASYVAGVRAGVHRRLSHHNRLLVGLAPILVLLALNPEATFLRMVLAVAFLTAVADLVLNQRHGADVEVWAELPSSIDLGVETPVPVAVSAPSALSASVEFVRGLASDRPLAVERGGRGPVRCVGTERGSFDSVTVQAVTGEQLGAVKHAIDFVVTPRRPLLVVPAPVPDPAIDRWLDRLRDDGDLETAGVRPFREGDRRRDVHWVSSARSGSTMVTERLPEPAPTTRVTIVVSGADEQDLCEALGRARHAAQRARATGWRVDLVVQAGPSSLPRAVAIGSDRELHEALAAARPGPTLVDEAGAPATSSASDHRLVLGPGGLA